MENGSKQGLRRQILDTARRLLISDGYAHLSMRKIAREIGYSATSIYLYFKNKDELVHSLIDEGVSLLHVKLTDRANRSHADPGERMTDLCYEYVDFGLSNPEYYEIMYMLHPAQMARYPAVRYRRARQNLKLLADVYHAGIKKGIYQTVEPMMAASIIWSNMHGVVSLLLSERIDGRMDRDRVVAESIRRILSGFNTARAYEQSVA